MATLRVVLKQRIIGNEVRNVFYVAGAYAEIANAQTIADYFRTSFALGGADMAAGASDAWELYGVDIKDVTDPANPVVPFNFTAGVLAGTNVGSDALPIQNCVLVSFKATTAPPNRSLKYLAGFVENSHTNDGWSSGTINRVGLWAQYLLDMPTNLDPGIALVVSRINANILVGSNILDTYSISPYARTQRRRTPGRGI